MSSPIFEIIKHDLTQTYPQLTVSLIKQAYTDLLPQVMADFGLTISAAQTNQYLDLSQIDQFRNSCPVGYTDLGESLCISNASALSGGTLTESETPSCDLLNFKGAGVIERITVLAKCDLDGWSQADAEVEYRCPRNWNLNDNFQCQPSSLSQIRQCSVIPQVDEASREVNARRCSATLLTYNQACNSTNDESCRNPKDQPISSEDGVYSSVAESFIRQTQDFDLQRISTLYDVGYFDKWLSQAGIHLDENPSVCPENFRISDDGSLCVSLSGSKSLCPTQFKKLTNTIEKLLLYSVCGYTDSKSSSEAEKDASVSNTPPLDQEWSERLVPDVPKIINRSGPIGLTDGLVKGSPSAHIRQSDLIKYDDSFVEPPLTFMSISTKTLKRKAKELASGLANQTSVGKIDVTPLASMGAVRSWVLDFKKIIPNRFINYKLGKEESDLVLLEESDFQASHGEREACLSEASICPAQTILVDDSVCMLEDPRTKMSDQCPYKGVLPARADGQTRRAIEDLCGLAYTCDTCTMDFNNFECPLNWTYEPQTSICHGPTFETKERQITLNVAGWRAQDRAEYAASNKAPWPCLDRNSCHRDYSEACPMHFVSMSFVSSDYDKYCVTGADPSAGLCPSVIDADHPALAELTTLYEKLVGKRLRQKSLIVWHSSSNLRSKITLAATCGAEWHCQKSCKPDYKLPCAIGWTLSDNFCIPVDSVSANHCRVESYSAKLVPSERNQLAALCGLRWPCRSQCQEDFARSCPRGWHATKHGSALVCEITNSLLPLSGKSSLNVTHMNEIDKRKLSRDRNLPWPCVKV